MKTRSETRRVVGGISALAALIPLVGACGDDSDTSTSTEISFGNIPRAASTMLFAQADQDDLWTEHNVKVDLSEAPSIDVLYQEFSAGQYDCITGDPGGFAVQASRGAPITMIASMSPNFANLVAESGSGIENPSDLAGKRLVATTASGAYKFFAAAAKEWYDVDLKTQADVINAPAGPQVMTQVSAGSADVGYALESAPTAALLANPKLSIVYNPKDEFADRSDGGTLWHTVLLCRTDKSLDPEVIGRLVDVLQDAASVTGDSVAADKLAVKVTESEPGVYQEIFDKGRLKYEINPTNNQIRTDVEAAIEMQQKAGTLEAADIPDSFYAGLKALK